MKKVLIAITVTAVVLFSLLGGVFLQFCQPQFEGSNFNFQTRNFFGIDIRQQTEAPMAAVAAARFDASPEQVFQRLADHANMREWVPLIAHLVEVDHSHSITPGLPNRGSVRICKVGGDTLVEDITGWVPNKAYSYSLRAPGLDHLGIITVEQADDGGSVVTWRQYIEPLGFKERYAMPMMINIIMRKALWNLTGEFGGELL